MRFASRAIVWAASGLLGVAGALAADGARPDDEKAIHEAAQRYLDAVARGDVPAMAACWTPTGDFVDDTGETYKAHELFEKRKEQGEAENPPQLSIKSSEIRFLGPESALEDGVSEMNIGGGLPPIEGRYSAVWVKRDGKWLLDAVREIPLHAVLERTPLHELEWMIGQWQAEHAGQLYDVTTRWNDQRTYLIREFHVSKDGVPVMAGTQVLGWDAAAKAIRSWVFDSAGGFSEALWTKHGDSWAAQSAGVLPDGRRTQALNLHSFDGKSGTWAMKSCHSRVGDETNEDLLLIFSRVPNS